MFRRVSDGRSRSEAVSRLCWESCSTWSASCASSSTSALTFAALAACKASFKCWGSLALIASLSFFSAPDSAGKAKPSWTPGALEPSETKAEPTSLDGSLSPAASCFWKMSWIMSCNLSKNPLLPEGGEAGDELRDEAGEREASSKGPVAAAGASSVEDAQDVSSSEQPPCTLGTPPKASMTAELTSFDASLSPAASCFGVDHTATSQGQVIIRDKPSKTNSNSSLTLSARGPLATSSFAGTKVTKATQGGLPGARSQSAERPAGRHGPLRPPGVNNFNKVFGSFLVEYLRGILNPKP